jgi:hypothetical protein
MCTITMEELFEWFVDNSDTALLQDLKTVESTLWNDTRFMWLGNLPPGWKRLASEHDCHVVNDKYPGRVFVFCSGIFNARIIPASFFLQAVAMREMQDAIVHEKLTGLSVPNVSLMSLVPKEQMESLQETDQPYQFVLVLNVQGMTPVDHFTMHEVLTESRCLEIAKLACLGFSVSSMTFWMDPNDSRLVVITRPLIYGALLDFEDKPKQHNYTKRVITQINRLRLAKDALRNLQHNLHNKCNRLFEAASMELECIDPPSETQLHKK